MAVTAPALSSGGLAGALARISPREKKLVLGLLLIVLMLAPLKAFDMRRKAAEANEEARAALAAAQLNVRRASGAGIAAQLKDTEHDVRAWSWTATSIPVGQVMVQNRVAELAANGGLVGAEARALPKVETAGPVTLAPVEVIAPFNWAGLAGFLSGLSATGKGFILDSVTMTEDKDPKVKLVLRLPLMIVEHPDPSPPA